MNQLIFDFSRRDYPAFDTFLGQSNGELLHVLRQGEVKFVYVWGMPGSGKSYLLHAWVAQAAHNGQEALYVDAAAEPLGEQALSAAYLAVDQVDRLSDEGQALLFEIFNRARNGAPVHLLLSADVPPGRLAIREDLRTRLGYCLVYDVKPLSDEEKVGVLQDVVAARQLAVDTEVFHYLLNHGRRDIDSLLTMLEILVNHAAAHRCRLTLPLVRQLLKQQDT